MYLNRTFSLEIVRFFMLYWDLCCGPGANVETAEFFNAVIKEKFGME